MSFYKHIGTQPTKFNITLQVVDAFLPDMSFSGGEMICVMVERGKGKSVIVTPEKTVELKPYEEVIVEIKEIMKFDCTLYRSSSGDIQPKTVKMSVLQRIKISESKTQAFKRDQFKVIGAVDIPLHEFADGKSHELGIPLSYCITQDAVVNVIFCATPIDMDDDSKSINSTTSHSQLFETAANHSNSSQSHNIPASVSFAASNPPSKNNMSTQSLSTLGSRSDNVGLVHNGPAPPLSSIASDNGSDHGSELSESTAASAPMGHKPVSIAMFKKNLHSTHRSNNDSNNRLVEANFESSTKYQEMKSKIQNLESILLASEEIVEHEREKAREAMRRADQLQQLVGTTSPNGKGSQKPNNPMPGSNSSGSSAGSDVDRLKREWLEKQQSYETELGRLKYEISELTKENQSLREILQSRNNTSQSAEKMKSLQSQLDSMTGQRNALEEDKLQLIGLMSEKEDEIKSLIEDVIECKMTIANMANELEEAKRSITQRLRLSNIKDSFSSAILNTKTMINNAGSNYSVGSPTTSNTAASSGKHNGMNGTARIPSTRMTPKSSSKHFNPNSLETLRGFADQASSSSQSSRQSPETQNSSAAPRVFGTQQQRY